MTRLPEIRELTHERFESWRKQIKKYVVDGEHRAGWDVEYLVELYRRAVLEAKQS